MAILICMIAQKSMTKSAVFLTCFALIMPLATIEFSGDLKPVSAKSLSSTCQKHADQLTNIVYQTDVEIEASKSQLVLAEERAKQLKELSESGAISSRELDAAQAEVKKAKKDLATAIARSKQAKQQLTTLQNMSACTV
jgi:multidrug resistance efflux pump